MTEREHVDQPGTTGLSGLLTPKATAIAGFTFAFFSLFGQGALGQALSALFWGSRYEIGSVPGVMAVWGFGCLVLAGLGAWLARSTLLAADRTWEADLARAALLVAALGAVIALLTIAGGLLH
ncbi:MAG TPA: hypothetical protein VFL69_09730 [Marmoricola sp.]|nr:hypothetical protein [Marmoricola sp.]